MAARQTHLLGTDVLMSTLNLASNRLCIDSLPA